MSAVRVAILFHQFGPYHYARIRAVQALLGADKVLPIELSNRTTTYDWSVASERLPGQVVLFNDRPAEQINPFAVFFKLRRVLRQHRVEVYFSPSYSPLSLFAGLLAAWSLGIKTVLMSESHQGTAHTSGILQLVKRAIVRRFDAGLVGGAPHKRYYESLGLAGERIFTGYDVVDNDFFSIRSALALESAAKVREDLNLPEKYILSLGRYVEKKNIASIIDAYVAIVKRDPAIEHHLVLVGSGDLEQALMERAAASGVAVVDQRKGRRSFRKGEPAIHFFGFAQIDTTPAFFALADVFVLASTREEWGLVVNEAMACGLPLIVSERVGCVEDLLPAGDAGVQATVLGDSAGRTSRSNIRLNGFIFDPEFQVDLENCLSFIINHAEIRCAMADESRKVIGNYTCKTFANAAMAAANAATFGRSR